MVVVGLTAAAPEAQPFVSWFVRVWAWVKGSCGRAGRLGSKASRSSTRFDVCLSEMQEYEMTTGLLEESRKGASNLSKKSVRIQAVYGYALHLREGVAIR